MTEMPKLEEWVFSKDKRYPYTSKSFETLDEYIKTRTKGKSYLIDRGYFRKDQLKEKIERLIKVLEKFKDEDLGVENDFYNTRSNSTSVCLGVIKEAFKEILEEKESE